MHRQANGRQRDDLPAGGREASDERVARAVKFINKRVVETVEKGAQGLLEIGQYVFVRFFHANVSEVHSRDRLKESTFRALANHPDLQISTTGLHNAVHLAVQEHELKLAGVPTSEHILLSHKVELLRLPDPAAKAELLAEIAKKRLSVRGVRARVDEVLAERRLLSRRPTDPHRDVNDISQSVRALLDLDIELMTSSERLRAIADSDKSRCIALLQEADDLIKRLIKAMEVAA
jgi:hypothetical protein